MTWFEIWYGGGSGVKYVSSWFASMVYLYSGYVKYESLNNLSNVLISLVSTLLCLYQLAIYNRLESQMVDYNSSLCSYLILLEM